MGAFAIPVVVEVGAALGAGAAMLYVWVASGKDQRLGRYIANTIDCYVNPECNPSESPYLAEARRRALAEDFVLKLKGMTDRFATTPPSIIDPPRDEPAGGDPAPPPSGGPSWDGMGLAMASVAALYGQLIYYMADGDASEGSTPAAGPQASATPELDAAAQGCLDMLQNKITAVRSGPRLSYGMDKKIIIDNLRFSLGYVSNAFQYLRDLGLQCPGYENFGVGNNGKDACNVLGELGRFFTSKPENMPAHFSVMSGFRFSSFFTPDEWNLLKSNPQDNFREVLKRYFTRICAPGALGAATPTASNL